MRLLDVLWKFIFWRMKIWKFPSHRFYAFLTFFPLFFPSTCLAFEADVLRRDSWHSIFLNHVIASMELEAIQPHSWVIIIITSASVQIHVGVDQLKAKLYLCTITSHSPVQVQMQAQKYKYAKYSNYHNNAYIGETFDLQCIFINSKLLAYMGGGL